MLFEAKEDPVWETIQNIEIKLRNLGCSESRKSGMPGDRVPEYSGKGVIRESSETGTRTQDGKVTASLPVPNEKGGKPPVPNEEGEKWKYQDRKDRKREIESIGNVEKDGDVQNEFVFPGDGCEEAACCGTSHL